MRKLNILKTIVDIFWILSLPIIPFILFFIPALFFIKNLDSIPITINGMEIFGNNTSIKIIIVCVLISYLLLLYVIYIFRNILRYFKNLKMFDSYVLINLNKMGYLLIICSFLNGIPSFIYKLLVKQKFSLEIGLNSFWILISLGLFFMILSEVFKISLTMKEENDLTV